MDSENTLAKRITTAGINAAYDEACKRLLANKQILVQIMKTCVEEFRECSVKDIEEKYIEGMVPFDIRFRAIASANGELISLIINIEAPNNYYPRYPLLKRGIY